MLLKIKNSCKLQKSNSPILFKNLQKNKICINSAKTNSKNLKTSYSKLQKSPKLLNLNLKMPVKMKNSGKANSQSKSQQKRSYYNNLKKVNKKLNVCKLKLNCKIKDTKNFCNKINQKSASWKHNLNSKEFKAKRMSNN